MNREVPSMDAWLKEARMHRSAPKIGMYLIHNGVVRRTARNQVRSRAAETKAVTGMIFAHDMHSVKAAVDAAYALDGIHYIKVWLNTGMLQVGDDMMYVLIGGDIRPHVEQAMQYLVERIKTECVTETELYT